MTRHRPGFSKLKSWIKGSSSTLPTPSEAVTLNAAAIPISNPLASPGPSADGRSQNHSHQSDDQDEGQTSILREGPDAASIKPSPSLVAGDQQQERDLDTVGAEQSASAHSLVEVNASESLWDRAYKLLDAEMVAEYDLLVDEIVTEESVKLVEAGQKAPIRDEMDPTSRNDLSYLSIRAQVDQMNQRGKDRLEQKKLKYKIATRTFVVSDLTSKVTRLVLKAKPLIDEAVKASPEASFAWVGVCLVLPLFTNPQTAHEAHLNGLSHVSSSMRYYAAIESLVLRKLDMDVGVQEELERSVVQLYTNILDFQCRSVLRCYRARYKRILKDWTRSEDWEGMLSEVEKGEAAVQKMSAQIRSLVTAVTLQESRNIATELLSAAQQQLQVQRETLQVAKEALVATKSQNRAAQRDAIERRVPLVPDALHNSREDEHYPTCQEDTRVKIRNIIDNWVHSAEGQTVFWLSGPAGTGKSTISRTVAQELEKEGLLGATYFFKRSGRSSSDKVFSTISRQLMNSIPTFDISLSGALENESSQITDLRLSTQCETLIVKPLSQIQDTATSRTQVLTRVIVIDAVDECESEFDIDELCHLLYEVSKAKTVRMLVFMASREVSPITGFFEELKPQEHQHISLLGFQKEAMDDIVSFLTKSFGEIKKDHKIKKDPWPESDTMARLVALATTPSPLFIYAATLCRFVDGGQKTIQRTRRRAWPPTQLLAWLNRCDSNASQLDQIYVPVIRQALFDHDGSDMYEESERYDILKILGSIIVLSTSLPSLYLASLLDMDPDYVSHTLEDFRPVLEIPDDPEAPVKILHTSFVDFMLGHEEPSLKGFRVDEGDAHAALALQCIERMAKSLKRDICNLADPGKDANRVDKSVIEDHIPLDLQYACRFWVDHLPGERAIDDEVKNVMQFLTKHLLHWLEVMSLIGNFSDAVGASVKLARRAQDMWKSDYEYNGLLQDIVKFVIALGSIIERNPLQAYGSALVFCPTSNMARKTQWEQRLPVIRSVSGISADNDLDLLPLEGHQWSVYDIAFSPDGKTLASGSQDRSVRFWDTLTGSYKAQLSDSKWSVSGVAYSQDGRMLVSASDRIRFWDTSNSHLERDVDIGAEYACSIVFIPNSNNVAAVLSDGTVRAWDSRTGQLLFTAQASTGTERYLDSKLPLAASHDGRLLGSAMGSTVYLLDGETGVHTRSLEGQNGDVRAIAFRLGDRMIAATSDDGTLQLWSINTSGDNLSIYSGGRESFYSVAFSPDGRLLATGSKGGTVWLWDIDDSTSNAKDRAIVRQEFTGHEDTIFQLSFSPDGKQLASASRDSTVRLWDISNGKSRTPRKEFSSVNPVIFSRDGTMVVSVTNCETITFWNAKDGTCQRQLRFDDDLYTVCDIDLSPDGTLIAISGGHRVCLWQIDFKETVGWPPDHLEASEKIDGASGKAVESYGVPYSVAFSPNGNTLAVGWSDHTIRLWDVATREHSKTLHYPEAVSYVAFSPDGRILASAVQGTFGGPWSIWICEASGDSWDSEPIEVLNWISHVDRLAFWPDSQYLETGGALLDLKNYSVDHSLLRGPPGDVYISDNWIMRDQSRIIWLPPGFRPTGAAARDNIVVLGHQGDQLTFLKLSSSGTDEDEDEYRRG